MTIEELYSLRIILEWSLRWYPDRTKARELLEVVNREIKLKTLNPVTGEYEDKK